MLGDECFSDEVVFPVLLNAVTEEQLHTMTNGWFWGFLKVGERLRKLVDDAPLLCRKTPPKRKRN